MTDDGSAIHDATLKGIEFMSAWADGAGGDLLEGVLRDRLLSTPSADPALDGIETTLANLLTGVTNVAGLLLTRLQAETGKTPHETLQEISLAVHRRRS